MKALIVIALVVAVVGGGLKLAGVALPFIDYPIGPMGIDTPGPAMPGVQIHPPGFDELQAP